MFPFVILPLPASYEHILGYDFFLGPSTQSSTIESGSFCKFHSISQFLVLIKYVNKQAKPIIITIHLNKITRANNSVLLTHIARQKEINFEGFDALF